MSRALPWNSSNGKIDEQELADCFVEQFAAACSSNSEAGINQLVNEYYNRKENYCCNNNLLDYLVSVELVDNSISKLKSGKTAALDQLTSELSPDYCLNFD